MGYLNLCVGFVCECVNMKKVCVKLREREREGKVGCVSVCEREILRNKSFIEDSKVRLGTFSLST